VLVDEAHHAPARTWARLLELLAHAKQVLFTATPIRRMKKEIKGKLVFNYDLRRAQSDRHGDRLGYRCRAVFLSFSAGSLGTLLPTSASHRQMKRRSSISSHRSDRAATTRPYCRHLDSRPWVVGGGPLGQAISPQTRRCKIDEHVRIASITKTFTGVATLQLVDDGRLSLDRRAFRTISKVSTAAIGNHYPPSAQYDVRHLRLHQRRQVFSRTSPTIR